MNVCLTLINRTEHNISIDVNRVSRALALDKADIIYYSQHITRLLRIKAHQEQTFMSWCFQEEKIGTYLCHEKRKWKLGEVWVISKERR